MLTSIIVVVITEGKIKNFKEKGIIYTILIISKYEILPKSGELRGVCLVVLSFA